ncbi:MAG TPA: YdjY domain-containing protein [Thermoanaerobaculia bacterium]|nr:YdjY domain-containing protein [Thermoanaerobaculia bacterium]
MTIRRILWLATAGAVGVVVLLLTVRRSAAQNSPGSPIEVDRARKEVRVRAVAHPNHLSRFFAQPGHHAVVWEKGRAHYGALFESHASDHDVRAALLSLGATPGENLTEATWKEGKNPRSPEPDKRVEGTPVDVLVEWPGSGGAIPLSQLILEGGKPASFDFRFGGNERFQKDFKSGCIVCDYSCPGGAIGNHNRTIRDETKLGVLFTVNDRRVPKDGTEVTVIFRPRLIP